jgi:hypothetical protein
MENPKIYFCGGNYRVGEEIKFLPVKPTQGLPYVVLEAGTYGLFRLCEHHSALYRIKEDGKMAIRERIGDCWAPDVVKLSPEVRAALAEAIEAFVKTSGPTVEPFVSGYMCLLAKRLRT